MAISIEVAEEIEDLLKKAESGQMARCGQLISLLRKHRLAWDQQISSSLIGIHPENRDGSGCSVAHCHQLCTEFYELGFSNDLTHNIAVELAPGDTTCLAFNAKLSLEAAGKLPSAEVTSMLRYASISGSHSNMAMRLFLYQVPHTDERLTVGGRLSVEKVKLEDPLYGEAIEQGMKWTIISHLVVQQYPKLPLLVQAAANSQNQVAQTESQQTSNRMKGHIILFTIYYLYVLCLLILFIHVVSPEFFAKAIL